MRGNFRFSLGRVPDQPESTVAAQNLRHMSDEGRDADIDPTASLSSSDDDLIAFELDNRLAISGSVAKINERVRSGVTAQILVDIRVVAKHESRLLILWMVLSTLLFRTAAKNFSFSSFHPDGSSR